MNARDDLRGWLWYALTHCPPASLIWASLGYRAGLIDGREQLRRELAADLAAAGAAWHEWRDVAGRPSHAELQRRRGEPVDQMRRNIIDRPLPRRTR